MSEEFDFWCQFIWFDSDFQIQHGSWRSSWKLAHRVVGFSDYCGVWVRKRHSCYPFHDDVIKWKPFPRYCPFVSGIHRSPVNSPHKGQWRGALMFSLIWAWIIGWVNNREAGDLRRYQAHHDVIVIWWLYLVLAFTLVILKTAIPIQKFIFCVYDFCICIVEFQAELTWHGLPSLSAMHIVLVTNIPQEIVINYSSTIQLVFSTRPFYHIQADSVADMWNGLSLPVEITKCNMLGF